MDVLDRQALEAFIAENDDLLALEEAIGRFNIFDALRIDRVEIRHSNFLAWLLNPNESHGQGDLFLKAILMDLLRQAPPEGRPLSPIELDGVELRGIDVRREWRNIDLLILCRDPSFVVAIENKIETGEREGQLDRYRRIVSTEFASTPAMFVFLTPDGDDASQEDWVPYRYSDLFHVLTRVKRAARGSLGGDVAVFLEHYLTLIRSRLMDNLEIDELCQRIYRNHRLALNILFERCGRSDNPVFQTVKDKLESAPERWHILNVTSKRIDFVPAGWEEWIPPLCSLPKQNPRFWIRMWINCNPRAAVLLFEVGPCKDAGLRRAVVERIANHAETAGFSNKKLKATDKWTRLLRIVIDRWDEDEPPDAAEFGKKLDLALVRATAHLKDILDMLRPIYSPHGSLPRPYDRDRVPRRRRPRWRPDRARHRPVDLHRGRRLHDPQGLGA